MHPHLKVGLDLLQLRASSSSASSFASTVNFPFRLLPADVREAEKIEGLRLSLTAFLAVFGRESAELDQSRLVGVQFQVELAESFLAVPAGSARLRRGAESPPRCRPHIARRSHRPWLSSSAIVGPEVEYVVEVDVCQQRADADPLRCSFRLSHSFPVLQHACVQPLLDVAQDALVRDPVLDEFHQPFVVDGVDKILECPRRAPSSPSSRKIPTDTASSALCWSAPRSESVGETEKILFVDCIQHLRRQPAGRSYPPTLEFRAVVADRRPWVCMPADWLCPVRSALQPFERSWRFSSRFSAYCSHVTPSTPAAAFRFIERNASRRRSMLYTWCQSVVNCSFFSFPAACRIRSSALCRAARSCARSLFCCARIPLGQAPSLHLLRRPMAHHDLCSQASSVLWACPTSRGRSSSVTSLEFPMRTRPPLPGQPRDLPVPARSAWVHAQGLRPRRSPRRPRDSDRRRCCLPPPSTASALPNCIQVFAAQYLACISPCQRFASAVTHAQRMTRGHCDSLCLQCKKLPFSTPRRFVPAHGRSLKG